MSTYWLQNAGDPLQAFFNRASQIRSDFDVSVLSCRDFLLKNRRKDLVLKKAMAILYTHQVFLFNVFLYLKDFKQSDDRLTRQPPQRYQPMQLLKKLQRVFMSTKNSEQTSPGLNQGAWRQSLR